MSNNNKDDKLERRVTAGLRGASWDPAQVPEAMSTKVCPMRTYDGAPVLGYLHRLGDETNVVFIMHPRELLVTHYLVPFLLKAGYAVWVQGPRTVGNDLRLEHETALLDVAAGMVQLQEFGFEKTILLGNSGGAGLFVYYNQQSKLSADQRVARTPGGRPVKLSGAPMPVADGFVFIAPHPGQGKLLMGMIDPSVTDENDALSVEPSLDPFSLENGFKMGQDGGAHYDTSFLERYRQAQRERVARIDDYAKSSIKQRMAEKKAIKAGEQGNPFKASYSGVFTVWRTDADPRCFDLSLDPSARRWGSVWGANPMVSNVGSVGFGRICTPESWLSTWSGLSSLASFENCGGAIDQPTIVIYYTGDNTVFPDDVEEIFNNIGSDDKQRVDVRGNHHGQSLRLDEENGQEVAAKKITNWLQKRF